jgi:hypothetical protein
VTTHLGVGGPFRERQSQALYSTLTLPIIPSPRARKTSSEASAEPVQDMASALESSQGLFDVTER